MGELSALITKNLTIWKRNKVSLIAEYVIVIGFAMVLGIFKHFSTTTDKPATSYLNQSMPLGIPADYSDPVNVAATYAFTFNVYSNVSAQSRGFFTYPMKACMISTDANRKTGGYVALITDHPGMRNNLTYIIENANLTNEFPLSDLPPELQNFKVKNFNSLQDMQDYVTDPSYGDPDPDVPYMNKSLCFGIYFNSTQKNNWKYSVSYNVSGNPSWYDLMALDQGQVARFKQEVADDYHWKNQIGSGLASMQEIISNLIYYFDTGATPTVSAKLIQTPTNGYRSSDLFNKTNNGDMSFFIMFPLMINFLKLVYMILNEKEKRIAENLRNMGMSLYKHYFSWLIFNTMVLLSTTLIWATIAKFVFFQGSNFIFVWLLMLLPGLTLQSCSFFIAGVFEKAKNGIIFSFIMLFLFDVVRTAKQAITNPSEQLVKWMSLAPSEGVSSSSSLMVMLESYDNGMGFEHYNVLVNGFKYCWFVETQIITIVFFFVLGLYLDQVWPSEIGVKRHPLFFILDCCAKKNRADRLPDGREPLIDAKVEKPENFEEIDALLSAQTMENKTLQIQNLRKVYSNGKVAVENLNLEMFTDQIFALLGHNGAGKTTTISMISGLFEQTSGNINILGRDTREEAKANRKILGVCPQTNPIYENLTCKEHLVLYATIKNGGKTDPPVSEREIDLILQDLDLYDKKNYPASKLSGGQKRKLCVAIAFIGGSKVILLDEPTSGMDTYARRFLWDMLRNYKKDRIIILSTHYMDEADYLGDRIGIMGKGKLITCGSSLFLKKRFGIGYDLTVVKTSAEVSSDKIEQLIVDRIPSAKKAGDISMEVKFQLPATESSKFEELFKVFEQRKEEYGIQTFGISLTTLEEVFLRVASLDEHTGAMISDKDRILETIADERFELNDIREKNPTSIFWMHFKALCKKRFIYFSRDKRGLVCEMVLPVIIILAGMFMTTLKFIAPPANGILPYNLVSNNTEIWFGYSQQTAPAASNMEPFFKQIISDTNSQQGSQLTYKLYPTDNITQFDHLLQVNPSVDRFYSLYFDACDPVNNIFKYNCFVNTTGPFSINLCFNLAENLIYKTLSDPSSQITIASVPFELTKQVASFQNTALGFITALLISIAYAFIPASVITVIVKERENNVKHQQIVSGVSILAYWLSNITVDFLKYLVPATATVIIMYIYDVTIFVNSTGLPMTITIFFLFGLSLMNFTYLLSFAFKSPSKAQFIIFLLNYLGGSILMVLSFILRLLQSTRNVQVYFIEFVLRLLPIYSISFGLFSTANAQIWQIVFQLPSLPGPWNRYCALWSIIYLILTAIVYFLIILLIEAKGSKIAKAVGSTNPQERLDYSDEDEDVTKERLQVENGQNYAVRVYNLMIEYVIYRDGFCKKKRPESTKLAVKGVSFGVQKGECFGLLGTNGAGKTSTFKVLSGEILPNYGQAQISGFNVETDMKTIGSLIGYCPQFDALLENLTAKEHLELYAAIKGIPQHMRAKLIESKLQQLNLKQYENVLAGTYSGGNKRKLSVAIALLGNPPIILLDEPSSGMDPEARRFMWSIVSQISTQNKTSSVILTTHSMEEAEALSSKLAIMVEGKIKCIGPVQQLKSKFGQGFEIEVKIRLPTPEEIAELKKLSGTLEERITTQEAAVNLLERTGVVNAAAEFAPNGRCFHFAQQISRGSEIFVYSLLEYAHTHVKAEAVFSFLKQRFGQVSLIEAVNTFYRFKIEQGVKLSDVFGALEPNQEKLAISQYSVKQTTIEQIFINFANLREEKLDD